MDTLTVQYTDYPCILMQELYWKVQWYIGGQGLPGKIESTIMTNLH